MEKREIKCIHEKYYPSEIQLLILNKRYNYLKNKVKIYCDPTIRDYTNIKKGNDFKREYTKVFLELTTYRIDLCGKFDKEIGINLLNEELFKSIIDSIK